MNKPAGLVFLLTALLLTSWPSASYAAVSVNRAELSGSDLRVEGDNAIADARILIDGVARGSADGDGEFRIEVSGFSSPTCRISVDDGTGAVTATLSGCTPTSTEPPPEPEPAPVTASSVSLSPTSVPGGSSSTATVTLSAVAPTGGAEVSLLSSNTSVATVSPSVTVPAGQRSTTTAVTTTQVTATSSVSISATSGGVTRTAALTVNPPPASTVSLSTFTAPATMTAGDTAQGVVTLTGSAPSDGATVSLFSTNTGIVRVPPSVTVPAGQTSASFAITAENASTTSATVSATYGGVQRSVTISVTAAETGQSLSTLSISPSTITDSESAEAIVSFTSQVSGDKLVTLSSSNTSVATVPPSVTVPAGAAGVTFAVDGATVAATASATITASADGVHRTATITVNPTPASGAPTVSSVTFSPSALEGGAPATGTVTVDGPATDGAVIDLVSSHPDLVQVQGELVFGVNSTSEAFPVTTTSSASDVSVTITATARCCGAQGASSGVLNVTTTTAPPQTDTVRITRIEWRRCIFSVEATGTNPNAILTVHLASSGSEVLELTNLGDGEWEGSRAFRPPGSNVPVDFVLRSNFGGTDTATVADRQGGACRADL